jgi:CheY-like chemotaxis protein
MSELTPGPATPARRVLVVVTDLFFGTRIAETARGLGIEVRACGPERALETARATEPALAIVDLTAAGDPAAAIAALRGDPVTAAVPVVAFYPHVETALRDRAVAAGATQVMPRSAFNARLAALLRVGPVGAPGAG